MSLISNGGGGGGEAGQHFMLVNNNNIIERVVQTSIGKGQSFTYRQAEPQTAEYTEEHIQEDSDGGCSTSSGAGGDRVYTEEILQPGGKSSSGGGNGGSQGRGGIMVDDKKMRRQIANSNERRRMQSINAGFQSLRNQLPHHEGEKLSKAAILQQTSEYIYSLEQERTQLLSQNCYLKRLLAQYDVGGELPPEALAAIGSSGSPSSAAGSAAALVPTSTIIVTSSGAPLTSTTNSSSSSSSAVPKNAAGGGGGKKRKMDPVASTIQATAVSDSSDEGLGSMSPEPFTILPGKAATKKQQAAAAHAAQLKQSVQGGVAELDKGQSNHHHHDIYTVTEVIHGSPQGITEIVEPCVDFEIDIETAPIEETVVVSSERSVPVSAAPLPKKKRITVESAEEADQAVTLIKGQIPKFFRDPSDMHGGQEIQELQAINSDSEIMLCSTFAGDTVAVAAGEGKHQPLTVIGKLGKKGKVTIIDGSGGGVMLEKSAKQPTLLDSFNKVENKVEVERISSSPLTTVVVKEEPGKPFLGASTSRQNLAAIVEAIRHLEGDEFGEQQPKNGRAGVVVKTETLKSLVAELPTQEVPLALTTKISASIAEKKAELSQFVHFKTKAMAASAVAAATAATTTQAATGLSSNSGSAMMYKGSATTTTTPTTTIVVRQLQQPQCRPGVIVAKQSS